MSEMSQRHTITEINTLAQDQFALIFGPVFEASPWIAEAAWAARPFAGLEALHRAMCAVVERAGQERQLALIRAHPDLAGRLAQAGRLTQASTGEQAAAGLDRLTPEETGRFTKLNAEYLDRFGFPFVICARLNKKDAILEAFGRRLKHTPAEEIKTALDEIGKIAELRLRDLIAT